MQIPKAHQLNIKQVITEDEYREIHSQGWLRTISAPSWVQMQFENLSNRLDLHEELAQQLREDLAAYKVKTKDKRSCKTIETC